MDNNRHKNVILPEGVRKRAVHYMVLLFFILLFTKSAFVLEVEKEKDASETRDIRSGASFFDKRALN